MRVTWPVPDASDLLSNPDLAPASVAQGIDADFDGTDPCARVGLEVLKTNAPIFAGVFGAGAVQTRAASVARGTGQDGSRKVIAGLNILEGTGCEALTTTDRGSINVNGTGGDAGVIAVESDGSTCNTGGAVIRPRDNPDSTIRSSGPDGVGDGLIQSFALNPAPTGNPSKAFINASRLFPQPTVMANRFGDGPVRSLFNCTSGRCPPGGGPWIEELRDKYAGPGQPLAFTTLPGAAVPTFNCNQDVVTVVPAGNWFLDCPGGLNVSTTLIFQGGVVVTTSAININRGGCLAVNVPATTCPLLDTAASPVTTNPAPTGDAILYVRAGRLFKDERASLYLPQTFTYLGNGSTDLQGRSGTLVMTTPLASGCGADAACSNRRFKRLVLWSEADQIHRMAGQSSLALRGVFFTPNAASTFVALRSGQNQTAAQFWTRTLVVGGRGEFVMSPDPDAAVPRPLEALGSVALIR